jgi:hypothetical protein
VPSRPVHSIEVERDSHASYPIDRPADYTDDNGVLVRDITQNDNLWFSTTVVEGVAVTFKLDTRAQVNTLALHIVDKMPSVCIYQ